MSCGGEGFLSSRLCPCQERGGLFVLLGRAQSFAERLRLGIAVIHGEAQDAESDLVDGRHSPPTAKSVAAIHPSLEMPSKQSLGQGEMASPPVGYYPWLFWGGGRKPTWFGWLCSKEGGRSRDWDM